MIKNKEEEMPINIEIIEIYKEIDKIITLIFFIP